jgi:SAM-dependent methyltransferase
VVEVGSGTGIATQPLAERGLRITCLEPAEPMAAIAKAKLRRFADVTHVACRFEDWEAPAGSCRAVIAANAWHWVQPDLGFRQAASVLGPSGALCILVHHVVQVGEDGFADAWREVRRAIAPPSEQDRRQATFMEEHQWSDDMEASGLFTHIATSRHAFTRTLDAEAFVAVGNTYRSPSRLSPDVLARLNAAEMELINSRYGGRIEKTEEAVLYVGHRRD